MANELSYGTAPLEDALLDLVVEGWRFARVSARMIDRLDVGDSNRHASSLRYFVRRMETIMGACGLSIVNLEGQPYDPGIPASAMNLGDFGADVPLLIDQMIEPVIMGPDGLRRPGLVKVGVVTP